MARRSVTRDEYVAELMRQGVPRMHWALKCPVCKTVQSAADLIRAGLGASVAEVDSYQGRCCIGYFTGAGPHDRRRPPGSGCDFSLRVTPERAPLEVVTPDGLRHPRFEPASGREARRHMGADPAAGPGAHTTGLAAAPVAADGAGRLAMRAARAPLG